MIELNIIPIAKPRMTIGDRYKQRKPVLEYWKYKDNLKQLAKENNLIINEVLNNIVFVIPFPKSYSNKKKVELNGKPHTLKPDLDNIIKAFQDSLLDNDSYIHTYKNISKVWGYDGKIIIG